MKKDTPFLDLYEKISADPKILNNGLCELVEANCNREETAIFEKFVPEGEEFPHAYWGDDSEDYFGSYHFQFGCDFNSMRKTLLCFCAVINEEI